MMVPWPRRNAPPRQLHDKLEDVGLLGPTGHDIASQIVDADITGQHGGMDIGGQVADAAMNAIRPSAENLYGDGINNLAGVRAALPTQSLPSILGLLGSGETAAAEGYANLAVGNQWPGAQPVVASDGTSPAVEDTTGTKDSASSDTRTEPGGSLSVTGLDPSGYGRASGPLDSIIGQLKGLLGQPTDNRPKWLKNVMGLADAWMHGWGTTALGRQTARDYFNRKETKRRAKRQERMDERGGLTTIASLLASNERLKDLSGKHAPVEITLPDGRVVKTTRGSLRDRLAIEREFGEGAELDRREKRARVRRAEAFDPEREAEYQEIRMKTARANLEKIQKELRGDITPAKAMSIIDKFGDELLDPTSPMYDEELLTKLLDIASTGVSGGGGGYGGDIRERLDALAGKDVRHEVTGRKR